MGKGCAQGGLSGVGGPCLRAVLPQGRWEPGSQYSQHLGYGCTGHWGWVHSPVRMQNAEWKLNTVSVSSLFVCIMRTNLLTKRCKEDPGYFWLIPHRDLDKSQNLRFLLEPVLCCCSKSGRWLFSSVGLEILPMRWWCLHDWDYILSFFVSPMVPSIVPVYSWYSECSWLRSSSLRHSQGPQTADFWGVIKESAFSYECLVLVFKVPPTLLIWPPEFFPMTLSPTFISLMLLSNGF